jgi:hypothetical protein
MMLKGTVQQNEIEKENNEILKATTNLYVLFSQAREFPKSYSTSYASFRILTDSKKAQTTPA